MTYEVDWEPAAVAWPRGTSSTTRQDCASSSPSSTPSRRSTRPDNAFPLGDSDLFRLRLGQYRAVYEIDETARIIPAMHVGRRA